MTVTTLAAQNRYGTGVYFDGTNDWLSLAADLTGVTTGKAATGSFFFRRAATGEMTLMGLGADFFTVKFDSSNRLYILGTSAAAATVLELLSSAVTDTVSWHHLAYSFDLTDSGKRHLYIDRANALASAPSYSNTDVAFNNGAASSIGATTGGSNKYNGDLAYFYWTDEYIDLSNATNLNKFVTAGNKPVDLGSNGSVPTGTAARVYQYGSASIWHVNNGTGGGFTSNGELTVSATSPED